uniref:Uncharacterized protein n=1 Tax=Latimeria chalumnae TaxID=7897 RepID=H3B7Y3_LATCH
CSGIASPWIGTSLLRASEKSLHTRREKLIFCLLCVTETLRQVSPSWFFSCQHSYG